MKKAKKHGKKAFPKPPALIYYPAIFFVRIYFRLRYGVTVDKSAVGKIAEPSLILSNHLSDRDHYLTALALTPIRPTFVLSAHFMMNRTLRPILKAMHVITKRMFDSDAGSVLNIMRAIRAGNSVVLFPEGRLTWYAHSMRITEGTADLIKKLKVNVYRIVPAGAALTFPKWAKAPRRGKIKVTVEPLFTADEIPALTKDEIFLRMADAFRHDDEEACRGIRYKSSDTALGLDGILFKCPVCGGEFTLATKDGHIKCTCGLDATLSEYYVIENGPFDSINKWYEWQYADLDVTAPLESDASVGTTDEDGIMIRGAGFGRCRVDRDAFTFDGEVFGEHVSFSVPTADIAAVPITVSDRFDIYHGGRLYNFTISPDPRHTVKWAVYFDRLTDDRIGTKGK